jgi:hypothetical protein
MADGRWLISSGYVWSRGYIHKLDGNLSLLSSDSISNKALFDLHVYDGGHSVAAVGTDGYLYHSSDGDRWTFERLSNWDILHSIQTKPSGGFLASGGKAFETGYIYDIGADYVIDSVSYFGHELEQVLSQGDSRWLTVGWGNIQTSADDGRTWTLLPNQGDLYKGIAFADNSNGIIIGANGTLLITNDGGRSFNVIDPDIDENGFDSFRKIYYHRDQYIIIGTRGRIWTSTDPQLSWQLYRLDTRAELTGLHAIDDRRYLVHGKEAYLAVIDKL